MKKLITLIAIMLFAMTVMAGQLYKHGIRVYGSYAATSDSTNNAGVNIFLDSATVDSIYFTTQNYDIDGYVSLTFIQLDSLKTNTDLDNLSFWVQSCSRNFNGTTPVVTVQGDKFTLGTGVDLNNTPKNSVTYNLTQTYSLNADEPDETMLNWLCVIVQNVGGAAADSAHVGIMLEAR